MISCNSPLLFAGLCTFQEFAVNFTNWCNTVKARIEPIIRATIAKNIAALVKPLVDWIERTELCTIIAEQKDLIKFAKALVHAV